MRWPRSLGRPGIGTYADTLWSIIRLRPRWESFSISARKSGSEHEGRSVDRGFRLTRGLAAVARGAARDIQGVWLRIAKKDAAVGTVSYAEALEVDHWHTLLRGSYTAVMGGGSACRRPPVVA